MGYSLDYPYSIGYQGGDVKGWVIVVDDVKNSVVSGVLMGENGGEGLTNSGRWWYDGGQDDYGVTHKLILSEC